MTTLPPFASTRAFEASARHLSFTKAADELCVTQSAVSRHIRHLETHLGIQLFTRGRTLTLTLDGLHFHTELVGIFRRLETATEKMVRAGTGQKRLHIHASTTFAFLWLIPRMRRFQEANPDIDLRLSAAPHTLELEQEQVHAVIRLGPGPFEGADRLFRVNLVPVCTPAVRDRCLPIVSLCALAKAPLLHSIASSYMWPTWFERAGYPDVDLWRGSRFESSAMTYAAAEKGLGIAIAQHQFVHDALARGELVAPFPTVVGTNRAYYLAPVAQHARLPSLAKFREWLLDEVRDDAARITAHGALDTLVDPP